MSDRCYERHGVRVLKCAAEGAEFRNDRDAVDLIGAAFQNGASLLVIPVERLGEDFFHLKTRIAGEMLQKFVNYQMRVVITGDISQHVNESEAFRDFVYEANCGDQIWFVSSIEELGQRLGRAGC
jgi:Domain of unknown function (DUF4180)